MSLTIREGCVSDIPAMVEIMNYYIDTSLGMWMYTHVTVEERTVWFKKTFEEIQLEEGIECPPNYFIVCENEEKTMVGYAYYSPHRSRAGWRFTKETSVYVNHSQRGKGIGSMLYKQLIEYAKQNNVLSLIGIIGGDNPASDALHKKLGFTYVGCLQGAGVKNDKALDAHTYQLRLK